MKNTKLTGVVFTIILIILGIFTLLQNDISKPAFVLMWFYATVVTGAYYYIEYQWEDLFKKINDLMEKAMIIMDLQRKEINELKEKQND